MSLLCFLPLACLLFPSGADNPTYLKKGGDKGVFALGVGLTTLCTLQMIRGMDNMKFGTGKIE